MSQTDAALASPQLQDHVDRSDLWPILLNYFMYLLYVAAVYYIKRQSGYNTYRGWTQTEYQNKHYNIDQKDERT